MKKKGVPGKEKKHLKELSKYNTSDKSFTIINKKYTTLLIKMREKKGIYCIFEGPEGSGKSTQINSLYNRLIKKGYPTHTTKEPGGTKIGAQIRASLLDASNYKMDPTTEIFLYAADRAQHTSEIIIPRLEQGYFIIGDRGPDSSLAYQGYGRGLDKDEIKKMNEKAMKGRKQDIEFIIGTANIEKWLERAKGATNQEGLEDRMENEMIEFHKKVMQGYLEIYKQNPDTHILIWDENGDRTKEDIQEEAIYNINQRFNLGI